MDDEHPLRPIFLKLDRADEHIHTVNRGKFAHAHPLAVGFKADFKAGWHTAYFEKGERHPPPELNVIAGEALYQARSALEHLVWALVKANHKKPGKDHTFPLLPVPVGTKGLANAQAFIAKTKVKELAGVPMAAIALIEKLQPYNTGNRSDYALTILHRMARDDRHRAPPSSFVGKALLRENQSIVVGQTNIARLKIEPLSLKPKVYVQGELPTFVAFGPRTAMLTLPAFQHLNSTVRQVLRLFEQFF